MVYLLWRLGKPPCTVHIFIPTILLLALFRKEGRVFLRKSRSCASFQHKPCWARELRSNTPCPGSTFSCTDCLVHTNRAGGSPLTGGAFFAEPQRGVRRLRRRERAAPAAGECADAARAHKRVDTCACPAGAQEGRHLRFPPSCESPLSLG